MNLSVQNYTINKNFNHTLLQSPKISFKGNFLTSYAFINEQKILEKIRTMPNSVFEEPSDFLKFNKSINVTPKISRAITKRLEEVMQAKTSSDNTLKNLIESSKRIVEGYKWFLDNGRELLKDEITEVKEIISDSKLPQDIRNNAKELLKRVLV